MIEVTGLRKAYGQIQAVQDVSFRVPKGEAFGLLGPNGAGKSTTIGMLCGLIRPDEGEIVVAGRRLTSEPMAVKRLLGVVPQDIALYPTLSARDNLAFWGRMYGLQGKELANRADEVLEMIGLTSRAKDRVETYSGGMKRRVNIGAALMHRPQVLIMDEPTVGIDPQSRNHILETIQRLNAQGMTVIYTSHYMEEVETLCQRVAIVDHGRILAAGTLQEVRQVVGGMTVIRLQLATTVDGLPERIERVAAVKRAALDGDEISVTVADADTAMGAVIDSVISAGGHIRGVHVQEPNLETVFLHLTGRALRD